MPVEPRKQCSIWLVIPALPKLAVYFHGFTRILQARKRRIWPMKKFNLKYIPIFVLFALSMALAPVFRAQDLGSVTRITPVPDGAVFSVDGQSYSHAASALWPAGSKHTLFVGATTQVGG